MSIEWIRLVMMRLGNFEKELNDVTEQLEILTRKLHKLEEIMNK